MLGSLSYNGEIGKGFTGWGQWQGASWENSHFCLFLYRSYLVPSYSFGENEVLNQESFAEGSWKSFFLKILQKALKKFMGLTFCIFHGRGLTKGSWGFLPFNRPITTVGELPVSQHHSGP